MSKPKKYPVVAITFDDHAHNGSLTECKAWGLLLGATGDTYQLYAWIADGDPSDKPNCEYFSILKAAVKKLKRYGMDTIG
jgi:hypothetical protein